MSPQEYLQHCAEAVLKHGPTRVLVSKEGAALPPQQAAVRPDVIFIRDDGWSLGAPKALTETAHRMYLDQWIGVMLSSNDVRSYAKWLEHREQNWES